mmetsp:Transcript_18322/g.31230  ORF Transcript_18322/g.31230 Transcript_18322/m.31230 type:complete len:98 (+) Transcript_18322:3-296(+)
MCVYVCVCVFFWIADKRDKRDREIGYFVGCPIINTGATDLDPCGRARAIPDMNGGSRDKGPRHKTTFSLFQARFSTGMCFRREGTWAYFYHVARPPS